MNNCFDHPCKYRYDDAHTCFCHLRMCVIPDNIDETGCKYFELAETCITCKHSIETVYETGTIDDIEYRCPFQNNALVYDDIRPGVEHFFDVDKCMCGKFELEE